jgi:hypothetical protein
MLRTTGRSWQVLVKVIVTSSSRRFRTCIDIDPIVPDAMSRGETSIESSSPSSTGPTALWSQLPQITAANNNALIHRIDGVSIMGFPTSGNLGATPSRDDASACTFVQEFRPSMVLRASQH